MNFILLPLLKAEDVSYNSFVAERLFGNAIEYIFENNKSFVAVMAGCKQDMPPAGGYAPITYKRIPLNKGLSGRVKLAILCGINAYGWYRFSEARREINNEKIEMRCSRQGFRPLLEAELDRMFLKQLKRNRDAEERIMKDVEGWEVGKYKGSRVFLTLGPDDYFKPYMDEYFAHAPESIKLEASEVDLYN